MRVTRGHSDRSKLIRSTMPAHRILIVDDNPDFRATMRRHLETWGYDVLEAQDVSAGIAMALEEAPDLLLLDYHMPYVNGIQTANNALAQRPDMPVLFLTGDFELSFLREMLPSSIHVVQKPFSAEDLQQNISRLLH